MSAPEKNGNLTMNRLGILAGGGDLPERLAQTCEARGIRPFIVALKRRAEPSLVRGRDHAWVSFGHAGQIPDILKTHNINDLVMIGSLRRPGFF